MEFSKRQKSIIQSMTWRKEKKKKKTTADNYQFHKVNFTFLSNWINFTQS